MLISNNTQVRKKSFLNSISKFFLQNLFRVDNETGAVIVNQPLEYLKARIVNYAATVVDTFPPVPQEGYGKYS